MNTTKRKADEASGLLPLPNPAPRDLGALSDLIIVVGILVAVKQGLLLFTQLYAGPASTLTAMVAATWLLRRRSQRWSDLGLRWPEKWGVTLGLSVLTFAVIIMISGVMGEVADLIAEDVGTSGRFAHVEGNLGAYLLMLVLVWTHGSFFEELLFRAFIITKISVLLGGNKKADVIAVLIASVFFGYRHVYYQGLNGGLVTGSIGLGLGLLYIWFGRSNIMPLILAHGAINSLGMTMRYLGITGD
ncbi:type II CAAX prenyl endopeptidase Rce1 family protein [Kordiimonas sp.]|uniref:CPBP family glutamic-type intramembrane protease n=1 Tax=Kordiimonas sp. TaxID=1970157 RepID=UPI003B51F5BC